MTQEYDLGYIRGAVGPTGPAGPQGPAGPTGATPSIGIGQVRAVAGGEDPYVRRRDGSSDQAPVLDFGLPGGSGDMDSAVYDPRQLHQDLFAYCDARAGRRSATVVVAAADSRERSRADLVCSGRADHITINQALALLPASGGRIVLLEGSYLLDCTGVEADAYGDRTLIALGGSGVSISGQGRGTRLQLAANAAATGQVTLLSGEGAGFRIANLQLDGNGAHNEGANVIGLQLGSGAADAAVCRLLFRDCSGSGLSSLADDVSVADCIAAGCGAGLYLAGGRAGVRGCCCRDNGCGVSVSGGQHSISDCTIYGNSDSGISALGGQYGRICGNVLWGQPLGVSLTGASDCLICHNIIFRSASGGSWGENEYPLLLSACQRAHAVGNYLRGKALSAVNCQGTVLCYSGNDWNPTV